MDTSNATAIVEDLVETHVGMKRYEVSTRFARPPEGYGLLTYTCGGVDPGYCAYWEITLSGYDGVPTPFRHPGLREGEHCTTGPSPWHQPGFATVENAIKHLRDVQTFQVEKAAEALDVAQAHQRELNLFARALAGAGIFKEESTEE